MTQKPPLKIVHRKLDQYCTLCRTCQSIYADYVRGYFDDNGSTAKENALFMIPEFGREEALIGAKMFHDLFNQNLESGMGEDYTDRCEKGFVKPDGENFQCCYIPLIVNHDHHEIFGTVDKKQPKSL